MQETSAGTVHGILVLDGPSTGSVARESELRSGALDVTDALAICVSDPAPEPPPEREPAQGRLYFDPATRLAYMRMTLTGTGWICVFDPERQKVGTLLATIRSDLMDIGAPCLEPALLR